MTTRDEPLDPQEVLAAAEAAHIAARRTVSIVPSRARAADRGQPRDERGSGGDERPTVRLERSSGERPTVRLDRSSRGGVDRPSGGTRARARAPFPLAAGVAAGWAALVSFVPVAALVTVLHAGDGPFAVLGPARVAAAGWLLAHGVPVQTPAGLIGLAPLLLTALAAARVARAGVHVTRAIGACRTGSPMQALQAAAAVGIGYGLIGVLAAVLAGGPGWGVPVSRAGLTLAGFGFLAAGYGSLRATGVLAAWTQRIPVVLRAGIRAGLVAACVVLAAGAALAGFAVAAGGGAAAEILAAYQTSILGQAGIVLLCLAYAPNLAAWAAAYLVGPGFAVGVDTVVRSSEVTVGGLPPVPVFAGLPDGPLPTVGAVLLVVPLLTGAASGWLVVRWAPGWGPAALGTVVSGVVAGGLLGLAAAVSSGPLGGGRLATVGPDPLLVAGFSAAAVTAGAVLGAVGATTLAARRRPVTGPG